MQWLKLFLVALCATFNSARKRNTTKLTLPVISDDSDTSNNVTTPCEMLRKEWEWNSFRGERNEEQTLSVALLWDCEQGYAAAALLRATLVAAGFNTALIKLRYRGLMDPPTIESNALAVEAMAAHLQVRLTPNAAQSSACANASTWTFYQDESTLRECGFTMAGTKRSADGIIYIVNEWDETCAEEFIDHAASSTQLELQELERLVLEDFIRNSNNSFLFLDNYQWTDSTNVRLVKLPYEIYGKDDTYCSSNLSRKFSVSLKFNDGLPLPEQFLMFSPSLDHINSVLAEYNMNNKSNIEEAACRWALREKKHFRNWQIIANPSTVVVIICKTELQDYIKELIMTGMMEGYANTYVSTLIDRKKILIQEFFIDCTDTNWLLHKLMYWFKNNFILEIEGVITTNDLALAAASFAMKIEIPLLTYDVNSGSLTLQPTIRSTTGSAEHLVLALRRLLAACAWQRIAIISESTRLAAVLSAALHASVTLTVREVNVNSPLIAPQALQELFDANAKVFFVNTGAAMAAAVLAAAQKLNMTRDKGFTWIVREYDTADNATSVTRPYSVSFWWRGERKSEKVKERDKTDKVGDSSKTIEKDIIDKVALRTELEKKLNGRVWPLHAAPILDALLTVEEGVKRDKYNYTWTRHRQSRSFWSDIKREHVQGIMQNLTYDENGVTTPLVFVQQWDSEPRPRLLVTWRGGELGDDIEKCPAEADPPSDGSTQCLISSGDPFHPSCRDTLWIICAVLGTLVVMGIIIAAIRWSRKILLAHDLRIKTEFAKRILARRERVFQALAEHLVDRSELELFQELGTGRFGRVYHGMLRVSGHKHRNVVVAAKTLREEASSAEESEFLREACTLATLNHEHIIRFVGVCVVDGPPLLLMEHAFFGDLLQYLRVRRSLAEETTNARISNCFGSDENVHVSAKALTKLAQEAATALAYLAQRGIVHRDVRASNCLVDERRGLKLADFGLARATGTVDGEYACRRGLFPVLWMAPESLAKGVSSAASDVWSFGVLVFELVTLGRRPYGTQPPPSVLQHVLAGGRPRLPWDASADTRALVRACWRREPEARPTATLLAQWLSKRLRALRPALVEELVDIESHVYGENVFSELDLDSVDTTCTKTLKKEKSS